MLNQKLQLKLSQKLSPQQIQLMKLIQMTTAELEQKVKNEIEENPALEHGSELSELIEDDSKEFDLDVHNEDINVDDYLTDPSRLPPKQEEGPSPEEQAKLLEAQVKQEELKIKAAEVQIKAQKIQQEYQKLQVDASLKQQEINIEREQKRAVAIGRT